MFSLGVLLLAVVAAATNGTCTCLDAYSSDVKKTGQTEDELEASRESDLPESMTGNARGAGGADYARFSGRKLRY